MDGGGLAERERASDEKRANEKSAQKPEEGRAAGRAYRYAKPEATGDESLREDDQCVSIVTPQALSN